MILFLYLLAVVMTIVAIVGSSRDACPRHSDCFDLLLCPLCSIRLLRQDEINGHVAEFEQGHNGGLFRSEGVVSKPILRDH
jgi:hypothetical protein